jgi:hypothetical protein
MTVQFIADADTYLKFFERIKDLPEDTEKERVQLLLRMVEEGHKISVIRTSRTREQIVEDYKKNYGNVLYFKVNGDDKDEI